MDMKKFSTKRIVFLLVFLHTSLAAFSKVVLSVRNTSDVQRHEIVAFDASKVCKLLSAEGIEQIVVKDSYDQQLPRQFTHDGKLLVEVSVRPHGEARFVVETGVPKAFRSYVDSYLSHWRADDVAWENDLCIYRAYGPLLQRSGEKAFGFDVWVKSTEELDARRRYQLHREACEERDQLRRKGQKAAANAAYNSKSYHIDHGRGLDCYKVGPSLGCGAPAVMIGDGIVMPWAYKEYKVLDNGPLRVTFELEYPKVIIDGQEVVEHRVITLDKGSRFNRISVWYDGFNRPMTAVSGVVVHTDNTADLIFNKNYIAYCDPTDSPERHNFQIYVATIYPEGIDTTRLIRDAGHKKNGIVGNAIGIKNGIKSGELWTYWFGASWCRMGTANQAEWLQQIQTFIDNQKAPLQTDVIEI
ncbi:hypothetical protein HMPREF9332_00737 [Alloprevotella rava F0323]|uniref:DUF4861 domain-containing protein n=2 Tax=Alloprevotella rava TaxID=671218 RepID=G5GAY6_9BACT|nr:hypothetical protein HMPREF9332_00737 [Alloprevotella rava F0323]